MDVIGDGDIPNHAKDVVYGLREGRRAAVREMALSIRESLAATHHPKRDDPLSLIRHEYCSCGAMEVFLDTDGYNPIEPVHSPCTTVNAIESVLQTFEGETR